MTTTDVDAERAPHLVVLLECDRPLAGGARYSLAGVERVLIGRGERRHATWHDEDGVKTLDVRLPGRSVSVAHARLVRVATSWAIEDAGSKNGIFLNGRRVERAVLRQDDMWDVGHILLRVDPALPGNSERTLDTGTGPEVASCHGLDATPPATLYPSLAARFEALARIAPSEVPVLLLGDSGTGKELLARWVHGRTGRRGEFVAVNCGAIPATLVEGTLFGHVKGAFSGAVRDEPGLLRTAHAGTLFLDEIADLPKPSQAALLRVLQEREVLPVGAVRPVPVDVRLVSATHETIDDYVARGDFRKDLFARIAGFVVHLPTLRERRNDFGLLVACLLAKAAGDRASAITFAPDAGRALAAHDWPLNVRELEQCLSACVALVPDGRIEVSHLPASVVRGGQARATQAARPNGLSKHDELLRLELLSQLARHDGNLADVARAMGKARMQVHRWCRRFGVDPNVYRRSPAR